MFLTDWSGLIMQGLRILAQTRPAYFQQSIVCAAVGTRKGISR